MRDNTTEERDRFSEGTAMKVLRIVGWGLTGLAFAALFSLIFGFLVKWLWNALMPNLFGLGEITFWQAVGVLILGKLIFAGFGPHRQSHLHKGRFFGDRHVSWSRFAGPRGELTEKHDFWKTFKDYWHNEGKAAFEAYVDRMEKDIR